MDLEGLSLINYFISLLLFMTRLGEGRASKSQQKCQKKIVYTSGEGSDIKKSKKVSKKIVYTSGEGSDIKKSKKVSKKNSLHFWGRT